VQLMSRELEVLEVTQQIRSETQEELDKTQREFYLRQQLKAIQKELGEEDGEAIFSEYRDKIEVAGMPEEAKKEALRELGRMEKLQPQSAEYGVIQTYLDWMVELPWSKLTEDNLDIVNAREVLNTDHYDMDDVKARILEYLAVRKLRLEREVDQAPVETGREQDRAGGSILLFVGPPGVGKTSLGQSIARAMGRKFERVALGGLSDEAELRGHRRTYVGAMPGRLLTALRRAGTRNPVLMLDEVDKLGRGFRGDPAAALLEVIDPAQNDKFRDNYLDLPFDLSKTTFIMTANSTETIPSPLLDRMEVVRLSGYSEEEKHAIARRYLLPRQLEQSGLQAQEIEVTDEALQELIQSYTREAGVRSLERAIAKLSRKLALRRLEGDEPILKVDVETVQSLLGPDRLTKEEGRTREAVGVATGLAWTPVGGDVLYVEAVRIPSGKGLTVTGQLGDVMSESVKAAQSIILSRADEFGISEEFLEKGGLHVHVPAGAIPKDGPSAGVTMVTALASVYTNVPVRHDVAMTGEVTLSGLVLPVGGIKEKVLAARRRGITTVILPALNRKDLEKLDSSVREEMQFVLVEQIEQVLKVCLPEVSQRLGEVEKEALVLSQGMMN
ncbi:MAG: endopeptidase La, partial [Candidatus Eremiobacteraeota bacterium]|nr:endopeptidase La [Candidatus Eremiobacteraeota bacterium]